MTTTINPVTTETLNSATTKPLSTTKSATAGSDGVSTEDSLAGQGTFQESLEKIIDDSSVIEEPVALSAGGNILPVAGKTVENTAEDNRMLVSHEVIPGLNSSVSTETMFIQNDDDGQVIPSVSTAEQSLRLDNSIKDIAMKTGSESGLLSASIRQLLQADVRIQGQNTTTAANNSKVSTASITTDGLVTRQIETSLLNADNIVVASQKIPATAPSLTGQLPLMSAQASLPIADMQSALLQQSSNVQDESSSSLLAASLSPASGSQSLTSLVTVPQLSIGERLGQPAWAQGMSKQIVWMTNQNISSAEIRLNPAHLGPIEVRIDIRDEVIHVALSSRHAVVREAMETALPKLREMFDNNGMNLADADISHQSFAEQREQNTSDSQGNIMSSGSEGNDFINPDEAVLHQSKVSTAMVDYYI